MAVQRAWGPGAMTCPGATLNLCRVRDAIRAALVGARPKSLSTGRLTIKPSCFCDTYVGQQISAAETVLKKKKKKKDHTKILSFKYSSCIQGLYLWSWWSSVSSWAQVSRVPT